MRIVPWFAQREGQIRKCTEIQQKLNYSNLDVFESWKSWKETGRVRAVQIDQFEREKLESLSLDDIFDDMRAKMLEIEICLVNSGNAGVGVVVALHGEEEAVERSAQVVGVENWSDEIVWLASSGEFGASRDCSFFQLELVEFCHRLCESIRLKKEYINFLENKLTPFGLSDK